MRITFDITSDASKMWRLGGFLRKVSFHETGCWLWTAGVDKDGYGKWELPGMQKKVMAHRFSYEALREAIPPGYQIDHLCRVRNCVNPDHLEPCTGRENIRRSKAPAALNRYKTNCPKGHPYSGDNLILRKCGRRACRACQKEHNARPKL